MGMYPGRFGGFKLSPRACDILLAGTLLAINLMTPGDHDGTQIDLTLTGASLSVFAAIALLARRRAPLTVLALTTAAATAYAITEGVKSPVGLFVAAAIYTVVLQKDRRTQWIAVTASAVLTIAISTAGASPYLKLSPAVATVWLVLALVSVLPEELSWIGFAVTQRNPSPKPRPNPREQP